jgi:cell filamentation protein
VTDPYVWPGTTCLQNKLGIRDEKKLELAEARLVSVRDVEIARETIPGEYDLTHLQLFHQRLFGDLYDWAGSIRTVEIVKGETRFGSARFLADDISGVFNELGREANLIGLNKGSFVDRLAYYYGEINARHPFREGNGRSQRAMDREMNDLACRENWVNGKTSRLIEALGPVVNRI